MARRDRLPSLPSTFPNVSQAAIAPENDPDVTCDKLAEMGLPRRTGGCTLKCCSTNWKLDEESDDGWDIGKGKRKYSSSSDEAVLGSTSEKVPPPLQRVGLCALGPGREITPFRPGPSKEERHRQAEEEYEQVVAANRAGHTNG